MGSTQANESFNTTVSSKAPKTQFYNGPASLDRRIASAVAQKNDGQSYLLKEEGFLTIHKKYILI